MRQIEWSYVESRHVIRAESIIGRVVEGRSLAEIKNKVRGGVMDSTQVSQFFALLEARAKREMGKDDPRSCLAYQIGWMREMIREAACDDVPMREIVGKELEREQREAAYD